MTRSRSYGAVFLPGLDDETVYLRQVDLVGTVDKTGRTGLPTDCQRWPRPQPAVSSKRQPADGRATNQVQSRPRVSR